MNSALVSEGSIHLYIIRSKDKYDKRHVVSTYTDKKTAIAAYKREIALDKLRCILHGGEGFEFELMGGTLEQMIPSGDDDPNIASFLEATKTMSSAVNSFWSEPLNDVGQFDTERNNLNKTIMNIFLQRRFN